MDKQNENSTNQAASNVVDSFFGADDFNEAAPIENPNKEKISTCFEAGFRASKMWICGKLNSEEIFPDFMHVSGPHGYQQITSCAIS